jgi:hypothetical protein
MKLLICRLNTQNNISVNLKRIWTLRKSADKFLDFPIPCFPIYNIKKIIFLGLVKEVRTTKS